MLEFLINFALIGTGIQLLFFESTYKVEMKNCRLFLGSVFLLTFALHAQHPAKLIVVISLDQLPYEYILKYRSYFTVGGFNYLLDNGANFIDCRYLHAATKTGHGHAVIMSGSYASVNRIVEN
ncbi:MAG: alkaline phosphatase family protein [Bacteroidota bacterium]